MSECLPLFDCSSTADVVWQCLENAVKRFNESTDQQSLLGPRNPDDPRGPAASERAISHRLAFYLESELRTLGLITDDGPLAVDCEYNRHGGAVKASSSRTRVERHRYRGSKKNSGPVGRGWILRLFDSP